MSNKESSVRKECFGKGSSYRKCSKKSSFRKKCLTGKVQLVPPRQGHVRWHKYRPIAVTNIKKGKNEFQ
jgi:hypothetical protein